MSGPVDDLTRAVEAALFAATEPMSAEALSKHLGGAQVRGALALLAAHYAGRGVQLVERGRRWHFQTAPDLAHLLRREQDEPRRLSRQLLPLPPRLSRRGPVRFERLRLDLVNTRAV